MYLILFHKFIFFFRLCRVKTLALKSLAWIWIILQMDLETKDKSVVYGRTDTTTSNKIKYDVNILQSKNIVKIIGSVSILVLASRVEGAYYTSSKSIYYGQENQGTKFDLRTGVSLRHPDSYSIQKKKQPFPHFIMNYTRV